MKAGNMFIYDDSIPNTTQLVVSIPEYEEDTTTTATDPPSPNSDVTETQSTASPPLTWDNTLTWDHTLDQVKVLTSIGSGSKSSSVSGCNLPKLEPWSEEISQFVDHMWVVSVIPYRPLDHVPCIELKYEVK